MSDLDQNVPDLGSDEELSQLPSQVLSEPVLQMQQPEQAVVQPPPSASNEESLQQIEKDLQDLLSFVAKNETLVDNLEELLKQNKERIRELEAELAKAQNEKDNVRQEVEQNKEQQGDLQKRLDDAQEELKGLQMNAARLEAERNTFAGENETLNKRIEEMQKAINDGSGASTALQADLEACKKEGDALQKQLQQAEVRENTLKQEKANARDAIQRIQGQINQINDKVRMQTQKLNGLGVQSGAGKNPFVYLRHKMQLVALNRKLNKASRKKLDRLANAWNMAPQRFAQKEDLLRALKIVLHCKLGFTRRKSQLKVVAKNMNLDVKDKKYSGKDICEIIIRKINRVSIKKAQEILA